MPTDARNQVSDRVVQHCLNGDKIIRTHTGRIIKVIKAAARKCAEASECEAVELRKEFKDFGPSLNDLQQYKQNCLAEPGNRKQRRANNSGKKRRSLK